MFYDALVGSKWPRDDLFIHGILGLGQGLEAPVRDNGVVKHLLMPIRLVREAVHQEHHAHLAHVEKIRLGAISAVKRTQAMEIDARLVALQEVSQREVDAGILV